MSAAEKLAILAARQWPIITSVPQLVMQRENIVFRVETDLGPHALRLHRHGYHTQAAIQSELAWMAMLAANDFPVPRPAPAISGNFLAKIESGNDLRLFSLLSWVAGEPFGSTAQPLRFVGSERRTIMFDIGRSMARLHVLCDSWQVPTDFTRPQWDADGLLGEQPFWGKFWHYSACSEDDRRELSDLRHDCLAKLGNYHALGADMGLIHADLARENILIDKGKAYFIDFDDAGFGYRLFDMATALIKNIHEPDFPALQQALLDGYLSFRTMASHHIEALPLFLLLRSFTYLGWSDARMAEPGMPERAARFFSDVKFLVAKFKGQL